jgi:FkbM family methyltransferase
MKQVHGIWIPSSDTHFTGMISGGRNLVDGKGTYQLPKYKAALSKVRESRRVAVDVGGHVGLWSRLMAKDFKHLVAFEPLPEHVDCYRRNMLEFANRDIALYQRAVSDRSGQMLEIEMPTDNTGHAHVFMGGNPLNGLPCVESIAIDDVEFPDVIDFMKIDVEGWELNVLQGAKETIMMHKPVIIIEQKGNGNAERYGLGQHDAVKLLKRWGMREDTVISGDHIMVW